MRAITASRPLRSVSLLLIGWIIVRITMLWPSAEALKPVRSKLERVDFASAVSPAIPPLTAPSSRPIDTHAARLATSSIAGGLRARAAPGAIRVMPGGPPVSAPPTSLALALPIPPDAPDIAGVPRHMPIRGAGRPNRFSASSWAVLRGVAGAPGAGGHLGGSQAGLRLFYEPERRGFALTARLSAALSRQGEREASLGVGLRGALGGLLVERRLAIGGGGRSAFAATAYALIPETPLLGGLRLEGYAQAGVVGVGARDGFADGAARIARPVARGSGAVLTVGAGAWGGIQPGLSRVDLGPELRARLGAGPAAIGFAASYRLRSAGNAAPGSGPALTMGMDF